MNEHTPPAAPAAAANLHGEDLVSRELALRRARQEAAARDTAGIVKTINVLRGISWTGALIPIVGIFVLFAGFMVGVFGSAFLFLRGNSQGGLRQLLITFAGMLVGVPVWFVANLVVIGLFG